MNLQYKINLTSLAILIFVTAALSVAGGLAITRLTYDLNAKLMTKEIANLQGDIQSAITILKESGVVTVEGYQQRAKIDVLAGFRESTADESQMLIVVDKVDGTVLLNGPSSSEGTELIEKIVQVDAGSMRGNYNGESRFFLYASNNEWNWLLILSEKTESIFEVRRGFIELVLLIFLLGLGVGFALLLWSTGKIVKPLILLAKAADSISHGRWENKLPEVHGHDEVAQLTSSFQHMAEKLAETYADLNDNIRDIRNSREELSAEKERLAITLRSIGDGVISTDVDGHITLINRRAEELTGWDQEDALGKHIGEVLRLDDFQGGEKERDYVSPILAPESKDISREQVTLIAQDSRQSTISLSSAPIYGLQGAKLGVILVFRDITEYLKIQDELAKSNKLESVGVLAGGIAHDFNNILTGILGNLSLAKYIVKDDDSLYKRLDDAEKASLRAKDLTTQLLTFSKGGEPIKRPVELSATIQETATFALAGSNCTCEFNVGSDLVSVEADVGQISQVIHNLVINGCQAMPEGGGVRISSRREDVKMTNQLNLAAGVYLEITIADDGHGIEKSLLSRIFDPYYSTKSDGKGLGLASAYSIMKKHEGAIHVISEPGQGASFELYLPASGAKAVMENDRGQIVQMGRGRVLILDDEEIVREVAGAMLASLGYEVDFAVDGESAIARYKEGIEREKKYDFVIMDLTIPGGMGGKEAIHHLLQLDPEIVAIVSSGYANDPIMANYKDHGFVALLTKPFSLEDLSGVVSGLGDKNLLFQTALKNGPSKPNLLVTPQPS